MNTSKHLVEGAISPGFIEEEIARHNVRMCVGANMVFLGRVRADEVNGTTVTGIEYSAYDEMIDPCIEEIREQLFREHDDLVYLHVRHSKGLVKCDEISLFVMVSTGHRHQAFRALEDCVELIKAKLPVWKKEYLSDGNARWIG